MNKHLLVLCIFFVTSSFFSTRTFGESYKSSHFIIYSDLDPSYIHIVQANAEAFYANLVGKYFKSGREEPLSVYCCQNQSSAQDLLVGNGHKDEAAGGYYIASAPAIYTYNYTSENEAIGWFSLFHGIASHLISVNSQKGSELFKKELAYFLGGQSQIIKGELVFQEADPRHEEISIEEIEDMAGNYLRSLFAGTEDGADPGIMRAFTQSFFSWLEMRGILKKYLYRVYKQDYKLVVLEETADLRYGRIKKELSSFIQEYYRLYDFIEQGRDSWNQDQKEESLLKAVELKPDSFKARMELAKFYYRSEDYDNCRDKLRPILVGAANIGSRAGASLAGDSYFKEKKYTEAMENYNVAWGYSDYYEYKYRMAYKIANCYHYLKDFKNARLWYQKFLDSRWEGDKMTVYADYAAKYLDQEQWIVGAQQQEGQRE